MIVRLLGGAAYWSYGLERLTALARSRAVALVVIPGDDRPDSSLDGLSTEGLEPAKTNWAQPIDTPPYYGYPLKTGITFTYLGVKVDKEARVQFEGQGGRSVPAANIFAAGEVMSGNILGQGYAGGVGMAIGNVFGRVAGEGAARHVSN